LVFRWAKANWPTTTADNLIDLVAADSKLKEFLKNKSGLRDVSQLCRSVAEYAFDEERLVIIVDAYDELDDKQKDSLRAVHAQALKDTKKVLWIITSRDYAVNEEKETFFKEDVFRRIRLQPFSRELQNQFMERSLSVSERLKGASDGRFKRGQFDRKGMGHSDRWILRSPSIGVCPWYVGWICTKRRESSICFRQGCPSERSLGRSESTVNR
jgi:hypothetical protein